MRLLANENVPSAAVEALRQDGHDVAWIRTDAPGISDPDVLGRALAEDRLLIRFDKDFGELVYHRGKDASRGVVLFRIAMTSPEHVAAEVVRALSSRDDWEGSFSVVEPGTIRMRPLP